MTRLRTAAAILALLVTGVSSARADVVLDWNSIAVATLIAQAQSPFSQSRYMSITQLAVFEAVNAITKEYDPYIGTIVAPAGASADAAAATAAYRVLKTYFPANPTLDPAYAATMGTIPDGAPKAGGVATGEAAAAQMIALRVGDGSAPAANYLPTSADPGVWQLTPSCPTAGGANFQWQRITPFGVPSTPGDQTWMEVFRPDPPPSLTSNQYRKDYNEVKRVGGLTSTERPPDRSDVARFYQASSPSLIFNSAARQVSVDQGRSISENARALALVNMASNDSLISSFGAKYFYLLWRPETAIRGGDLDGNDRTDANPTFAPYIVTPCFPSYPSNHASGSSSAAEILRRIYGEGGHAITLTNPAVAGVTLQYTTFNQITDDVDDARVFGGIHFRFDQEAGSRMGRDIATFIYKNNLRPINGADK